LPSRATRTHRIRIIIRAEIVPELTSLKTFSWVTSPYRGPFSDWRKLERRTHEILRDFGMSRELSPRQQCTRLGPAQRQILEIMRAIRAVGRLIAFESRRRLDDDEARRLFQVSAAARRGRYRSSIFRTG
jgi:L-arabinose transport system ATP-binding protein